ncbi:MAG: TlpA family protein disulfide reductase [Deltaproteobacteria bacterium]|nr:TlpA family protein disulfide reductase [Deltaproteobacteria bacterium]
MSRAVDVLLSDKVLYPVLGLVFVAAVAGIVVRPRHGTEAQDFSLPVVTAAGRAGPDRMALRDLRGQAVLLDFWATWCGPCRIETPILVRMHQRFHARGLTVVGVNTDALGPAGVPSFQQAFNIPYPMLYDEGGAASNAYQVEGLPTLVLIDRAGRVRLRHAGVLDEAQLSAAIAGVL